MQLQTTNLVVHQDIQMQLQTTNLVVQQDIQMQLQTTNLVAELREGPALVRKGRVIHDVPVEHIQLVLRHGILHNHR